MYIETRTTRATARLTFTFRLKDVLGLIVVRLLVGFLFLSLGVASVALILPDCMWRFEPPFRNSTASRFQVADFISALILRPHEVAILPRPKGQREGWQWNHAWYVDICDHDY